MKEKNNPKKHFLHSALAGLFLISIPCPSICQLFMQLQSDPAAYLTGNKLFFLAMSQKLIWLKLLLQQQKQLMKFGKHPMSSQIKRSTKRKKKKSIPLPLRTDLSLNRQVSPSLHTATVSWPSTLLWVCLQRVDEESHVIKSAWFIWEHSSLYGLYRNTALTTFTREALQKAEI